MKHGLLDVARLQASVLSALDHSDNLVLLLERPEARGDAIIAAANDAFCRTSGFAHEDLVGRPFFDLLAAGAMRAALADAIDGRHSLRSEVPCRHRAKPPFWFGLHLMPVPESDPAEFVVLGRDISEALRSRQEQSAVQGLLAKAFLCARTAVAILDESGTILMTNPACDELLGYPPNALEGRPARDVAAPRERAKVLAARDHQLRDGKDYAVDTIVLRADGSELAVRLSSSVVEGLNLKRFRILTLVERPPSAASVQPIRVRAAGKIKLIGLEEIREALGPRWPDVAERVMATAEAVLKHSCGPTDSYSKTPDSGFLICFGSATEDEACFRAGIIARDIRRRLIGEGETPAIAQVSAIAAAVDVPESAGQSREEIDKLLAERLRMRMGEIEVRARRRLADAMASASCVLEPIKAARGNDAAFFATAAETWEQQIWSAVAALPPKETADFDLDCLVLGLAAEQAAMQLTAMPALPVLVSVEFEVFLTRRRAEHFITACARIDDRASRNLIAVLTDIPNGTPESRLLETASRLRPYFGGLGLAIAGARLPAAAPSVLNGAIVVAMERELAQARSSGETHIAQLVQFLHARHAKLLVRQVDGTARADALREAGVDLISRASG